MEVRVRSERLPHASELPLPAHATAGAAGMDLLAALPADAPLVLRPGERAAVPPGIRMPLPRGLAAQVCPRSGLALHHGVTVANAPGTVDADDRGEVMVLPIHPGRQPLTIRRGMRIARLVVAPVVRVVWEEERVREDETGRGAGGFGSTGTAP